MCDNHTATPSIPVSDAGSRYEVRGNAQKNAPSPVHSISTLWSRTQGKGRKKQCKRTDFLNLGVAARRRKGCHRGCGIWIAISVTVLLKARVVNWLRTDPYFNPVDRQILALRASVSVRVTSARVWVKTRQGIGASKVVEGNKVACACACECAMQSMWQQTLNHKRNNF